MYGVNGTEAPLVIEVGGTIGSFLQQYWFGIFILIVGFVWTLMIVAGDEE